MDSHSYGGLWSWPKIWCIQPAIELTRYSWLLLRHGAPQLPLPGTASLLLHKAMTGLESEKLAIYISLARVSPSQVVFILIVHFLSTIQFHLTSIWKSWFENREHSTIGACLSLSDYYYYIFKQIYSIFFIDTKLY